MSATDTQDVSGGWTACAVSIEIDGRQRYLFETDKLQEMLGASRIMAESVPKIEAIIRQVNNNQSEDLKVRLFGPVSGEIRAWAPIGSHSVLLTAVWQLRRWLAGHGVEHTVAYLRTQMRHFMNDHDPDERLSVEQAEDPWNEPAIASLAWVHHALSVRMGVRKAAKVVEDARPSCSLFASCQLHSSDAATDWDPAKAAGREPRRGLRGRRAAAKFERWDEAKQNSAAGRPDFFFSKLIQPFEERFRSFGVEPPSLRRAHSFEDLSDMATNAGDETSDNRLAFLCADGDGLGQALARIDWNAPEWRLGATLPLAPWERNARFAQELNASFEAAFVHAAAVVVVPDRQAAEDWKDSMVAGGTLKIPTLPQLLGGDDLWLVARKDVALHLAAALSTAFRNVIDGQAVYDNGPTVSVDVVRRALELFSSDQPLSVSLGVAFAKSGYPVWSMIEAAESLMAQAKLLRKEKLWGRRAQPPDPHDPAWKPDYLRGCIDWYWIESSVSEGIRDARDHGWAYEDDGTTLLLTTRPWTAPSVEYFEKAAHSLRGVARRKREQLEQILRLGYTLSLLGWERWWKRLSAAERKHLACAREMLALAGWHFPAAASIGPLAFLPWCRMQEASDPKASVYVTPWLDLLVLDDILND